MIVRILTEGQWELDGPAATEVQELDDVCVRAVEAGEEQAFHESFDRLLELVRGQGTPLADDDLRHSELMLPPGDTSLAEAQQTFTGEGLLPD